ncbi:MAG: 50S ribosomal protein L30 [Solirubrobacterales bacterium]|nr:50S ribosomal protein L30 [Solirubrobacterales bacterium]
MAEVAVRQVRSSARATDKQRDTLRSLKLGRIGRKGSYPDTPQLRGMLRMIDHLVEIDGSTWEKGVVSNG